MLSQSIGGFTRRRFLAAAGAGTLAGSGLLLLPLAPKAESPETLAAIRDLVGDQPLRDGRIQLQLATLQENGRVVPLEVMVESPMTEADHVKLVHVLVQNNPSPLVASYRFTPAAGRARVDFRFRMGGSSPVIVLAAMSDGSIWRTSRMVTVTIGGCGG